MHHPLMRAQQAVTSVVTRAQQLYLPEPLQGPGCLLDLPAHIVADEVTHPLVVTTPGIMRRGQLDAFLAELERQGLAHALSTDVVPDPDAACAQAIAERYEEAGCDGIVAVGGGSAMDAAKVAGALIVRPHASVQELEGVLRVRHKLPKLYAVPTTAGTGSETTAAAVITDPSTQRKHAISDLVLIPHMAVLDPELLVGLPPTLTAYTGMDALTHAVEAYTNRFGSKYARERALRAVREIFQALKPSYDDGADLALRERMLRASFDAGVAFTCAFVGYVHAIAHGVGGRYHTQHGLANAVILPYVLEEFGPAVEGELADLAWAIGLTGDDNHELAQAFIAAVRSLGASMDIPEHLEEIQAADIRELARGAEQEGNPGYPVPVIWDVPTFERVIARVSGVA